MILVPISISRVAYAVSFYTSQEKTLQNKTLCLGLKLGKKLQTYLMTGQFQGKFLYYKTEPN